MWPFSGIQSTSTSVRYTPEDGHAVGRNVYISFCILANCSILVCICCTVPLLYIKMVMKLLVSCNVCVCVCVVFIG